MKRNNQMASHLGGFSSGASLGGKVSRYRNKQNIYTQGAPAYTLFYIQEGGVPGEMRENSPEDEDRSCLSRGTRRNRS